MGSVFQENETNVWSNNQHRNTTLPHGKDFVLDNTAVKNNHKKNL
jgi:hypothetical protein